MELYWPYLLADYIRFVEYVAAVVAVIILISSLDDLFVDAWYWGRRIYRRFVIEPFIRPLTPAALYQKDEQPLAIMIPAWLESPVIAAMIENMVSVLDYRRYVIFVGTYPNDPDTIAEVERMRRRYKQLVRVETRNPGPTNKADCLNTVVRAIFQHEQITGVEFAGLVLHDAEDVLHPLELRYFSYLLPRKDLIQVPVLSLERHWSELVAGIYMDEFAEWHAKDLVVRESVAGSVPSAGVGTCFSRKAMLHLLSDGTGEVFNTSSLTEDYDISARLSAAHMQSIIARLPVEYVVKRESLFGFGEQKEILLSMPLCVREFFPDTFRTSYRQKARWSLGIAFQGWRSMGWRGNWATKYFLFRDRKGIVTSLVAVLAYVVAAHFLIFMGAGEARPAAGPLPLHLRHRDLAAGGADRQCRRVRATAVAALLFRRQGLWLGTGADVRSPRGDGEFRQLRCHRARVEAVHGPRLPRPEDRVGQDLHDFPDQAELGQQRQRLGELLLTWQAVLPEHVEEALSLQAERQQPLGRASSSPAAGSTRRRWPKPWPSSPTCRALSSPSRWCGSSTISCPST